ncbi:uncharacterized protein LOC123272917 [Cotesia glomerata]|uniref:uncharacterized protein LOC123272917 n=1 Tax=Cotesia glomerata TaxID=32391 RepID=UPI001D020A40|nr:uncharacterized protein LOC123272917 [Cotesia glomerata]
MSCSCAAGLGGECKHVVATLLYLNRNDLESLKVISCTDKKCAWSAPKQFALQQYDMKPLLSHSCLVQKINLTRERKLKGEKKTTSISDDLGVALQVIEGVNHMDLQESDNPDNADNTGDVCDDSEPSIDNTIDVMLQTDDNDKYEEFRRILIEDNPLSALAMHMHDPVQAETNKVIISPDKMTAIIKNQQMSELLLKLKNFDIKFTPGECCRKTLSRLSDDTRKICEDTHEFYSVWIKERQLRITASDAYKLFTYRKNKNPDWKKKSVDYFFGESFSNANTKYGLENESIAREAYEAKMSVEVVHCGLIISKENPWLGGSPDGIIFKNNQPYKILDIKCPVEGKKTSAEDLIKTVKWLEVLNGEVGFKKKHIWLILKKSRI